MYVNAPTHAPSGGAISPLNGEFYDGGQFMCNQFAMPKGYAKLIKKAVAKSVATTSNIAQVFVSERSVSVRMAGSAKRDHVFFGTREQNKVFAGLLIDGKSITAQKNGEAVHPTEIIEC